MNQSTDRELCAATAVRRRINDKASVTTIGCLRPDGHDGLHFCPVHGDWADTDVDDRPYSPREHLLRRLAGFNRGMSTLPQDIELIDAYAHELAEKIRAANPYDSYAFSNAIEFAADLIDPEATHASCGGTHVRSASGAVVVCLPVGECDK